MGLFGASRESSRELGSKKNSKQFVLKPAEGQFNFDDTLVAGDQVLATCKDLEADLEASIHRWDHEVGDNVDVLFDGEWHPAQVSALGHPSADQRDYTYTVTWMDGTTSANVPTKDMRAAFEPGTEVEARHDEEWYRACIGRQINGGGYDVVWETGEVTRGVPADDVRGRTAAGDDSDDSDAEGPEGLTASPSDGGGDDE